MENRGKPMKTKENFGKPRKTTENQEITKTRKNHGKPRETKENQGKSGTTPRPIFLFQQKNKFLNRVPML